MSKQNSDNPSPSKGALIALGAAALTVALAVNYVVYPIAVRRAMSHVPALPRLPLLEVIGPTSGTGSAAPPKSGRVAPANPDAEANAERRPNKAPAAEEARTAGGENSTKPDRPSDGDAPSPDAAPSRRKIPTYRVDRRELNRRLDRPKELSKQLRILPHYDANGRRRGLKIARLKGDLTRYGLRPGDVVVAVNGRELTTQQSAMTKIHAMRKKEVFVLDVLRDGRKRTFRYILK